MGNSFIYSGMIVGTDYFFIFILNRLFFLNFNWQSTLHEGDVFILN